jgi:hypothetical protein
MIKAGIPIQARNSTGAALYAATVVLALLLPFESIHPLFSLPWFEVTSLELALLVTVLLWMVHVVSTVRPSRTPRLDRQTVLSNLVPAGILLFLFMAALSTLLAPANKVEAMKALSRLVLGGCVFLIVAQAAYDRSRIALLLWALVLSAGVSALLGVAEAGRWPIAGPVLALFKPNPTLVGGELRVSASFQYATIASMYFEMIVPLALAVAVTSMRQAARVVAMAVAAICSALVVLTLTRAGMLALATALGFMLALGFIRPALRPLRWPAIVAAMALCSTLAVALSSSAVFTRMTTENDMGWYNATYVAPEALTLDAGEQATVTVEVRNTGRVTWTAEGNRSFALGYRWLRGEGEAARTVYSGEAHLPHDVAPGEIARVDVTLDARVEPAEYHVLWDVLQRGVLWFSYRSVPEAVTLVRVTPDAAPAAMKIEQRALRYDPPVLPATVPRGELWSAALAMIAERPVVGSGPDSFRHTYGRHLGLAHWDERLHANNLYLEFLADLGLGGSIAFALLIAVVLLPSIRRLRSPAGGPLQIWAIGIMASMLAFFVHGLLDYFFQFTSLYLLFWMLLGLVMALERAQEQTSARTAGASSPRPRPR